MFAWLFNRFNKNPIASLRSSDKAAWCRKYFPEYADLWEGDYPPSIPVVYAEAGQSSRFSGTTRVVEIAPWEYFDGLPGSIDEFGWKWADGIDSLGRKTLTKVAATEEEYVAWCNSRNYYRNGNVGLDPALLVGAIDRRDSAYKANMAKYRAELGMPRSQRKLLTKPDKLVSPYGTFFPERGPDDANPWGVNASFHPSGSKDPSYVSKRWGPDYRPDQYGQAGGAVITEWDAAVDGPKPSQADYDRARYLVWL